MRVLFLLQRPEAWVNLASVWDAMHADTAFDPTVWLLPYNASDPRTSADKAPQARSLLGSLGVPFVEWHPGLRLEPDTFDVVIFNHPYDRERPRELWFERVATAVRATLYIPYGLPAGGGRKNLRLQYAQPVQMHATAVVARSPFEKSQYARHCPTADAHVHVLGLPRFDRLLRSLECTIPESMSQFANGRTTLLWNSHFSFGHKHSEGSNFSTFDLLGPELFDLARRRNAEVCIIWRPHPGLLPALVGDGLLDSSAIPRLRDELASIGVLLDDSPDHVPAFLASHALLTDPGSFLIEYLAMDRPVLALVNPEGEPANEEAEKLRRTYRVATRPEDVEQFVTDLLSGQCRPPDATLREEHLPLLDRGAGQRVAALVRQLLDVGPNGATVRAAPYRPPVPPMIHPASDAPGHRAVTARLDALCRSLIVVREEKRKRARWRKRLLRLRKRVATEALEWLKQHPTLLALSEWLRRGKPP